MIQKFDFLIIGSGLAGMSFALKVAHKGKVALICKTELEEANTYFAQGGVASVTNTLVDNFEKHIEDTMIAGDWLSDRAAVEKVVKEAPSQIKELISWGVEFSFFVFIEVYTPTDQFLYLCGSFTYDFFYSGTVTDPVTGNHCIFNMFFKIVYQQIGH